MSWPIVELQELALQQKGAIVSGPFGSSIGSRFFVDDGVPVIRGKNLTKGEERFIDDGFVYLTETKAAEFANCIAVSNDVVFTAAGSIGQVGLIPMATRYEKYVISNKQLRVRLDETKADPLFVYYWLSSKRMLRYLEGMNNGGAVPLLNLGIIRKVPVPWPEIKTQKSIASILSAYDDLIENNQRRIQLLEQAARLLYKEWFVHLRFPGHEHVTVTDGVPEGWDRKKIADVCATVGGGTPSTKVSEYWEGDITWVVPSDVTSNKCLVLLDSERKITERGLRESSAKMVPPKSILMTSRASVGYFALMDFEVCTNQGFINIVPNEDELRMYLLFNLMSRVAEIRSNAKGTTYPEISKGRFRAMDIVVPSKTLLQEFADVASDVVQQVRCLTRAIYQLQAARELLLPRLMNGEIAV